MDAFEHSPSILDVSAFTSFAHCEALLSANIRFPVSATLYNVLYEEYDRQKVFNILRHFVWRPLSYLPLEKLDLRPLLEPYRFKSQYLEEIYPYYERNPLPIEVKQIILDEYSFLKEHSSVLMYNRRFAKYLHNWGVVLLDATNKLYDGKKYLFERIRGVRWIIGMLLTTTGMTTIHQQPLVSNILAAGGTILVLFDP